MAGTDFQRDWAYNRGMDVGVQAPVAADIMAALDRGGVVLTANQRAARSLRQRFDRHCHALGKTRWEPAAILAWETWTTGLWRQMVISGKAEALLLNRTQEHAVWRSVLEADDELQSLRTRESLAEMAAETWARLCRFNGLARLRAASGLGTDTRSFQRWARGFERRCREDGLLSQAQLEEVLRRAMAAGEVDLPAAGVALVGFDEMTPAQAELVEALRDAGVAVEKLSIAMLPERRMLVAMTDEREELSAAARWVRRFLEGRNSSGKADGARVAVIVPGLEDERAEIDRVFRETLAEELEDIRSKNAAPYEFSLGVKLADVPMIAVAFDLLRWVKGSLPLERVSGLLLSPYFADAGEQSARAEFDAFELRKARMLRPEISLEGMIRKVEESRKRRSKLARLQEALRTMQRVAERRFGSQSRSYAEWSDAARELLIAAGWSAPKAEDSVEFQVRRRWESALDELATLDFNGERVGFEEALARLERIARQTTFAPESREAPVQVMGPLEAAGETFDAVWFLHTGDLSWPVAASASPLLPWALQKELRMPGTDAIRDRELARRMTEGIAESAPLVVFSYAKESKTGRQKASSALERMKLEPLTVEEPLTERSEPVKLEEIVDMPAIAILPDRAIHGGAAILEVQSACGFRAFAERRLMAARLESVELGMDAAERGQIVHKTLEVFWDGVKTQATLLEMTGEEREEVLGWSINESLKKMEALCETPWDVEYIALQRERLKRLLRPWLEMEMSRPAFEVMHREEKASDVQIGPLRLNVRIDRVDLTAAGEVVIDYKTGRASPNDWLTERPDAPQLPLYAALADPERLGGVVFGLLRAGREMGWKGFAADDGVLAKPSKMEKESFEEQVEEWRRVLTALAKQFAAGDARVSPKSFPRTCTHCSQRLLCRLDRLVLEDGEEELDSGDDASTEAVRVHGE